MTTRKKDPTAPTPAPTVSTPLPDLIIAAQGLEAQVNAIDNQSTLLPTMSVEERGAAEKLIERCPDSMIGLVADAAKQHGGTVAGVAFNATDAADVLDYEAKITPIVKMLLRVAEHLQDDVIQRKAQVCTRTSYVFGVLGTGLRKRNPVPEVVGFKSLYDKLRVESRAVRKPARRSAATTTPAATPATPVTAPSAPANAATPSATPSGNSGNGTPHS